MVGDSFCVLKFWLFRYERGMDELWFMGLVGMVDCLLELVFDGDFEFLMVVFIFIVVLIFFLY